MGTQCDLRVSEDNCSVLRSSSGSSSSATLSAASATHDTASVNANDSACTSSERSKKHSGPRKRRPKKKPTSASNNDALPPTNNGSAVDDIDMLLQQELARTAAALRADDADDDATYSTTHTSASPSRTAYQLHAQASALALADSSFALPSIHPIARSHECSNSSTTHSNRLYTPRFTPQADVLSHHSSSDQYQQQQQQHDRAYWTEWVIAAAEKERARRLNVLKQLQYEEEAEIQRRRKWAIDAIEREQEAMMREMFLDNMKNTQWFQSTISRIAADYEVVCPNSWFGCTVSCMLRDVELHLESCVYRQVPDTLDHATTESDAPDFFSYDVVCPNAVLGCNEICAREELAAHLAACPINGISREKEWEERLEGRRNVLLATEQERARRVHEQQQLQLQQQQQQQQHNRSTASNCDGNDETTTHRFSFMHLQQLYEAQTATMQVVLHDEIVDFCAVETHIAQQLQPSLDAAIATMTHWINTLWGDGACVERYGSVATQLHGSYSDVDLVVFGVAKSDRTSQQCVTDLAAHLATTAAADASSIYSIVDVSAITKASIPLVKAVVLIPLRADAAADVTDPAAAATTNDCVLRVPIDITFDDPAAHAHNGIASAALVSTLVQHFVGLRELALVLKHFLVKRGVNDPYVGGLSSYGLLLMIVYVLQAQGAVVAPVDVPTASVIPDDVSPDTTGDPSNQLTHARCAAQRRMGERVALEIVQQSLARQEQQLQQQCANSDESMNAPPPPPPTASAATKRTTRRLHWPSLFAHDCDADASDAKPQYVFGKLLLDFLQFYGNDFRQHVDAINVAEQRIDASPVLLPMAVASRTDSADRTNAAATKLLLSPPLPPTTVADTASIPATPVCSPTLSPSLSASSSTTASSSPSHEGLLVIRDPLQPANNVGQSCYRVSQVCRDFSDFLSFLTALIVRGSVMTTGKKTTAPAPTVGVGSDAVGAVGAHMDRMTGDNDAMRAPSSSHRILTSVFEMQTRDTRASIDLTS